MPNINRRPPVDTSQANLRNADQLRAERETISQPRNVLVNGGGEALVNRRALLETHRSFQAVMKQVDPTTARLQARPSPAARAAAPALSRPAPNLFERFAQAVSTTYHEYRANSAASDLARQIKGGRFDAGSVDLLASLTQHAAHLDPAGARQARSHPAITLLQGKLAGADGDTLMQVRNSPVFGDLKAANARKQADGEAMLLRLEGLGFGGGAEVSGAGAAPPAGTALKSNRHLDKMQLILGHVLNPDTPAGPAPRRLTEDPDARAIATAEIDANIRDRRLAQARSETALATQYPATAALPASRLDPAKLSKLGQEASTHASQGSFLDIKAAQLRGTLRQPRLDSPPETVRQRSLQAEHIARDGLASLVRGMDEPTRRRELLSLAQGDGYLARGAMHLLGQGNRVDHWRTERDGLPREVTFGGQRYEFDRQLGAGANGLAVRYRPTQGDGPGIVLKATKDQMGDLGLGEADPEKISAVGKEFANHMHAMSDGMQGHPNPLAVRGLIVAHAPSSRQADSINLYTVMEEAGAGPENLVKDINLLRQNNTLSEATHGLLMRSLFAQMVEGCAHLEDRQIVHRDIKLENMLVSQDGRVLIMDLGEGDTGALSDPAPIVGSPLSMSPELQGGSSEARMVDTWALGVVWRQMSNSRNEADPRNAAILGDQRDGDIGGVGALRDQRQAWAADAGNAVHSRTSLADRFVAPPGTPESDAPSRPVFRDMQETLKQAFAARIDPRDLRLNIAQALREERITPGEAQTLQRWVSSNLDGVEQLTNAMLHPDQAQRPTLAALRSHHAIADPALQDPRLLELTRAIQAGDALAIARLNQALTPAPQSQALSATPSGVAETPKSASFGQFLQRIVTGTLDTAQERDALLAEIERHQPATERGALRSELQSEWTQRAANRPEVLAQAQAERVEMGARLTSLGLRHHDVRDDGHCLFHAIAHQTGVAPAGPGDSATQLQVRQQLLARLNTANSLTPDQRAYVAGNLSAPSLETEALQSARQRLEVGVAQGNQNRVDASGWGDDSHARLLAVGTGRPVLIMSPGGDRLFDPRNLERALEAPLTEGELQALQNGLAGLDGQPQPIVLIHNGANHWQSTARNA